MSGQKCRIFFQPNMNTGGKNEVKILRIQRKGLKEYRGSSLAK
jgi:hypothetical protein